MAGSIAHHPLFQQALSFYGEMLCQFEDQQKGEEERDPEKFHRSQEAFSKAEDALVAVIDAIIADEKKKCPPS